MWTNKPITGTNSRKHQPTFAPMFLMRELAGMSIEPSKSNMMIADPLVSAERMPPKPTMNKNAAQYPSLPIPSYVWGDVSVETVMGPSGGEYALTVGVVVAGLRESETGGDGGGKRDGKASASRLHSSLPVQT